MNNEYQVEIVFRQRAIYRVRAADRESAERAAAEQWRDGGASEVPGYDWSELDSVNAVEAPESSQLEQDAQLVLRYLREREQLITRLGAGSLNPGANDAISAAQLASDLGWTRAGRGGAPGPDMIRATEALEWLCGRNRAVCFPRRRVRAGERGEIRLYCTPEYLQSLTEDLGIDDASARNVEEGNPV
jgi:hypothetical protein